jgi:Effector-associated domain 1
MELDNRQREQLQKALISAFPSSGALKQMVDFGLNENLDSIVTGSNYAEMVFSLIKWAQSQGRLTDLIKAARERNFGNEQLRTFDEQLQQPPVIKLLTTDPNPRMLDTDTEKTRLEEDDREKQTLPGSANLKNTSKVTEKRKKAVVSNSLLEKLQPEFLKPARRYYKKFKRTKKPLQTSYTLFCNQEDIYPDLCDRTLKVVEDLSKLVLIFRDSITRLNYQIKVEMNHIIEQANQLISELRVFRGECPRPPLAAYNIRQKYDHNRQEICYKLEALLSILKDLDNSLKDFFAQSDSDAKETH